MDASFPQGEHTWFTVCFDLDAYSSASNDPHPSDMTVAAIHAEKYALAYPDMEGGPLFHKKML